MAITINSQPASPKFSYGDFVYSVSSTLVGPTIPVANRLHQYSFVVDLYVGGVLQATFAKQPSPVGVGVFNLASAINDYLQFDVAAIGSDADYPGIEAMRTVELRFGERYLVNDVLTIHDGRDAIGTPDVSSNTLTVFKGFDDYDTRGLTQASVVPEVLSEGALLDAPIFVHRTDMMNISIWNGTTLVHHAIDLPETGDSYQETISGNTFNFQIYDERPLLGDVRFAWFNRQGGIDFFTADLEGTSSTNVDKQTYNSTNIDYGRTNPTITAGNTYRSRTTTYAIDYLSLIHI